MAAKLKGISPYFLVDDVYASAEYYRDTLCFKFEQFWGEPPKFVMVHRDGLQIMLRERDGGSESVIKPNRDRVEYALDAYIYCDDTNGLHEEFTSKGADVLSEPYDQPHDCREFELRDMNGYILCFGQDLLAD